MQRISSNPLLNEQYLICNQMELLQIRSELVIREKNHPSSNKDCAAKLLRKFIVGGC